MTNFSGLNSHNERLELPRLNSVRFNTGQAGIRVTVGTDTDVPNVRGFGGSGVELAFDQETGQLDIDELGPETDCVSIAPYGAEIVLPAESGLSLLQGTTGSGDITVSTPGKSVVFEINASPIRYARIETRSGHIALSGARLDIAEISTTDPNLGTITVTDSVVRNLTLTGGPSSVKIEELNADVCRIGTQRRGKAPNAPRLRTSWTTIGGKVESYPQIPLSTRYSR